MAFHCTEPFVIILPSSRYDLNNVGRDVKHQLIIMTSKTLVESVQFICSYRQQISQVCLAKCACINPRIFCLKEVYELLKLLGS